MMNPHESATGALPGGSIAIPDEATLVERARELARIDGREEPNDNDFAQARNDLVTTGSMPAAPEAGELENLTAWDTPLTATGRRAQENELDDEASLGEKLVEEGVEEADHDVRLTASDEMEADDL